MTKKTVLTLVASALILTMLGTSAIFADETETTVSAASTSVSETVTPDDTTTDSAATEGQADDTEVTGEGETTADLALEAAGETTAATTASTAATEEKVRFVDSKAGKVIGIVLAILIPVAAIVGFIAYLPKKKKMKQK